MDSSFLFSLLAILSLLSLSSFIYMLSKRVNIPYTVLLVVAGLVLVPLTKLPFLHFIAGFKLTPEMLFFVFLPVLIFESGYNMGYRSLLKNWKSIGLLAVLGLLISTFLIGFALKFALALVGINVPIEVTLLFGTIISSTDPVAVLSLFKQFGAPRRLVLIFEGESLFNDGTALALFLVMLEVVKSGTVETSSVITGILSFLCMLIGGMIFGSFMGLAFSKLIEKVRGNENLEIAFTMIAAHATFILSELISEHVSIFSFELKVSGVIATALASIVLGNYGRYKISHKTEEYMESFWSFVAFVANSLVFLLLGVMFFSLKVNFLSFIVPIATTIAVVIVARGISVYLPIGILNVFNLEEKISSRWQHLLAWGSLRGALALMMVLMIPDTFSITGWSFAFSVKDFLLALTIGSIMFTLFVKAPSIGYLISKLKISKLHDVEHFQKHESMVLIYRDLIAKIESIKSKGHITDAEHDALRAKYDRKLDHETKELKKLLSHSKDPDSLVYKAISLHALGIEKQYLKDLYRKNEVDEYVFKYMLGKIERQLERIEGDRPQVRGESLIEDLGFMDKLIAKIFSRKDDFMYEYFKNRTKYIVSSKVIEELDGLKSIDFGYDTKALVQIVELYKKFNEISLKKMNEISLKHQATVTKLDVRLVNKALLKLEERLMKQLYEKEFITPKLFLDFSETIEHKLSRDIKTFLK